MIARPSILVAVVCIAVLMLTFGLPTASARGTTGLPMANPSSHTIVVKPNGHDDTTDLQAAFDTCTSHGWTCTIQLVKGTYWTDQVTSYGFQGGLIGAGQGATIIQGLPNLPPPNSAYAQDTVPFFAGLPGPSNPWPVLFTFVGGAFRISGMTISDTYANPVQGFDYFGGTDTALWSSILVTGEAGQFVTASVDHVTINGGQGINLGFNDNDEIAFEGLLLPSGWTDPWGDAIPLTGSFSVTSSVFHDVSTGPFFSNLLDSSGVACFDTVTTSPSLGPSVAAIPFGFYDLSDSQLTFCNNLAINVPGGAGIIGQQSFFHSNLLPSTVYTTGNVFLNVSTGIYGMPADGLYYIDWGPIALGTPGTLTAVITGNVIQTDTSSGAFGLPPDTIVPAIAVFNLASVVVSHNLLLGGGGVELAYEPGTVSSNVITGNIVGVLLYTTAGVLVSGNVVTGSETYGIALFYGSSDNTVTGNLVKNSGEYDLFSDGTGTGNTWTGNVCNTSSPPGLC